MASITKLGKGKQPPRAVDFIDPMDRKRKRIRLGIVSHEAAQEARLRIERLSAAIALHQAPDLQTLQWLNGISDEIHARVARQGLCEPREPEPTAPELSLWLNKYIDQRKHELAPSSIERIEQSADRLRHFFGEKIPINTITPDAAKEWRASMLAIPLSEATVRLHSRNAKGIFNEAVDRELIKRNPFSKLKSASIAANRDRHVSLNESIQILEACPNLQWRLLFSLNRFAGLRCSSETHGVTWRDVDWDRRRLTVFAPKTGCTRIVPIVPKLFSVLQEAFCAADEGAESIITMSTNNLPRNFKAIIRNAGLVVWSDLFQTLRRSCETDFAKKHPQHAVSAWMGHSMKVSERFYLQLTDDLYAAATADDERAADSAAVERGTLSHGAANDFNVDDGLEQRETDAQKKTRMVQAVATPCGLIQQTSEVDRGGIEPPTPGFSVLCSTN